MKAKSTQTWDCPSDNKGAARFGGKKSLFDRQVSYFVLHEFEFWQSSEAADMFWRCKKEGNKSNENNHGGSVSLFSAKLIKTSSSKKMNQVKRPQDWGVKDYFNPKHIQMKCMLTHACLFVLRASSIQTLTEADKVITGLDVKVQILRVPSDFTFHSFLVLRVFWLATSGYG